MASTPHLTAALDFMDLEYNAVLQCRPPACTSNAKHNLGICLIAGEVQWYTYCYHSHYSVQLAVVLSFAVVRNNLKDALTPAVMSNPFDDIIRFRLPSIHLSRPADLCKAYRPTELSGTPSCDGFTAQRLLSKAAVWMPGCASNGPPWIYFMHGHLHVIHLFGQDDFAS